MKKQLFTLLALSACMTFQVANVSAAEQATTEQSATMLEFGVSTTNLILEKTEGSTGVITFTLPNEYLIDYNPKPTSAPTWFERTAIETNGNLSGYRYTVHANTGPERSIRLEFKATGYTTTYVTITQKGTNSTAVATVGSDGFVISPNPTVGNFTISADGVSSVSIYSENGCLISRTAVAGNEQISTEGIPAGRYIVKVQTTNGELSGQLIKE